MTNLQPLQALNLDSNQQQNFVKFIKSLPEKPNTTVRFFNRQDYYTLHGEDAQLAAREIFKSPSVVKVMGCEPNKMDYLVLSTGNFEIFVRQLLLVKLYRIEVYTNQGNIKGNDWVLEFKGSPGNLSQFEDILFLNSDIAVNPTIVGVQFRNDDKVKMVGLVCVDVLEGTFSVAEFADDEHFSELEAMIVQLGPKECLIPASDVPEKKTMTSILERSNVGITQRKKAEFSLDGLVQDLNRLLHFEEDQQKNANVLAEVSLTLACGALNAVIKYLQLPGDKTHFEKYKFKKLESVRFVHLNSSVMYDALNILPKKEGSTSKTHSLLGLLDRCRTAHGKRLIARWVRNPLRDLNSIEERLDVVSALVKSGEVRRQLHEEHMRRIPDLQALTRRLHRDRANLQDCYKIYQAVERLPYLMDCLKQCEDKTVKGAFIDPLRDMMQDLEKYQQMISTTIDMDLVDKGEFLVKASFDDQLQELREQMEKVEFSLQQQLTKAGRELGLEPGKSIKLDHTSVLGYHFRITLKEEPVLRKNKSFTVIDAIKGGVRFKNDKLDTKNTEYQELKASYEEHQKTIVTEIIRISSGYSEVLFTLSLLLAKLDVLLAFSVATCEAPIQYVRPKMVAAGQELTLEKVRHPCLELQDGISYIANDVNFKRGEHIFSIITGPNMGGKSTYIRSVGVASLMAHLGCFVPCASATVPLLDSILARVGAGDCQARGISTFMLEMVETSNILRTATADSLIIIDELGRGTSTYEGCGIAWAIAEHLAKETQAFCLFATHFHEVTQLSQQVAGVRNFHVTGAARDEGLAMLYELRPGPCDRSFGIHVAKMADFPQHVIHFAETKQSQLESCRFDNIGDEAVRDKEKAKVEAEQLMSEFIRSCADLDPGSLSHDEMLSKMVEYKLKVQKSDNPFVKALIDKL